MPREAVARRPRSCTFDGRPLAVMLRDRTSLRPGDRVRLAPDVSRLHLFDAQSGHSLVD